MSKFKHQYLPILADYKIIGTKDYQMLVLDIKLWASRLNSYHIWEVQYASTVYRHTGNLMLA